MAQLIHKKIESATLIEVLVAMVIIMVIFSIAMGLFANVLNTGVSFRNIKVQNQLNVLSKKVVADGFGVEQSIEIDSIIYQYEIEESDVEHLSQLTIRASAAGKTMAEVKTLFRRKDDEKN